MKKYVIAGTGNRGFEMYAKAITERFSDCAELVGLYDINPKRCAYVASQLKVPVPVFDDFEEMIRQCRPDGAIITTVDRYHSDYIVKALEMGVDVISEKPMTIDAPRCREILEAEKRTGHKVIVTFNCRFMPQFAKIKELLMEGAVGDILNVDFEWMLDTSHGADYFRRWHRMLENSGGLLVHKSTHHFDVVNWLIEQDPVTVYANGDLMFYGKDRQEHGERCSTCQTPCEYKYKGLNDPKTKELYFDCEDVDGYYRDRCIFDNEINIYDDMSLSVKYSKGALMSYSLIAHAPYEGWKMSISGTKGRLESCCYSSGLDTDDPCFHIQVFNRKGDKITYDLRKGTGTHGGGDDRMLEMLFRGGVPNTLRQYAGSRDGSMSILIGICANESIRTGQVVKVKDLVDVDSYQ
ncbi:MAG: Gfo/Idh/MocA family oxidoreductase [Firmicutes bacterium]|nr:Gfo/Idh/MocA family oxidoreductase [Bacillota bacterium]